MASDILIVDDEADIREMVAGFLQDDGHRTRLARDSDEALKAVEERRPQLVILDIWLQGSRLDGLEVLNIIKKAHPDLPVVIISGHGNIETAVTAIKRGAYDYIEKPFKADRLLLVTLRALEASKLQREVRELRERSVVSSEMIGKSPAMNQLRAALDRVAPTNSRVLIRGSAGSGKELVRARDARQARSARTGPSWCSTPPPWRPTGSRRSCSAPRTTPARARSARWRRRTAARSTSTRSPTCRWRRRARCCACWWSRSSSASAAARRCRSTCASSPPPAATWSGRCRRAASARTSTTASTWCRCACRAWPSAATTSRCWSQYFVGQIAQSSRPGAAQDRRGRRRRAAGARLAGQRARAAGTTSSG